MKVSSALIGSLCSPLPASSKLILKWIYPAGQFFFLVWLRGNVRRQWISLTLSTCQLTTSPKGWMCLFLFCLCSVSFLSSWLIEELMAAAKKGDKWAERGEEADTTVCLSYQVNEQQGRGKEKRKKEKKKRATGKDRRPRDRNLPKHITDRTDTVMFSISGLPCKAGPAHVMFLARLYGSCHLLQVQFDFQLWCIHPLCVRLCRWVAQQRGVEFMLWIITPASVFDKNTSPLPRCGTSNSSPRKRRSHLASRASAWFFRLLYNYLKRDTFWVVSTVSSMTHRTYCTLRSN